MDQLGQDPKGFSFFDGVKPAAMDHPHRRRCFCCSDFLLEFSELAVQPGEVIGLADPHNSRKNMEPPHREVDPFPEGKGHVCRLPDPSPMIFSFPDKSCT